MLRTIEKRNHLSTELDGYLGAVNRVEELADRGEGLGLLDIRFAIPGQLRGKGAHLSVLTGFQMDQQLLVTGERDIVVQAMAMQLPPDDRIGGDCRLPLASASEHSRLKP